MIPLLVLLGGCTPEERDPKKPVVERFPTFERVELLDREPGNQRTTNVRLAPIGWGPGVELVVTELNPRRATWLGCTAGGCASRDLPIPEGMGPARSATADLDADGDLDLVLADLGKLETTNERVGSIWVLWSDGQGGFTPEQLGPNIGRACCAEPGDLDGDGDLDLTVCAFGHETVGAMGWLEQTASGWERHVLTARPGAIHAFPVDVDDDGDLDIVAAFAQLSEMVLLYRNDGAGRFAMERLYNRRETWWGVSGIEPADLDQDGDIDVILTHGDTMDGDTPEDLPIDEVHGVEWLENDGTGHFTTRHVGDLWGAYTIRVVDLDGDRDRDVVVGAIQDHDKWPDLPQRPLVVFVNDGAQRFTPVEIPDAPPQIVSVEVADLDEDGLLDLAVGSLEFVPDTRTVRLDGLYQRPGGDP